LSFYPERRVYSAAVAVLLIFLASSIWLAAIGADNCGCFGTKFASTPAATIAKNTALLAIVSFLRAQITDVGSVATASA
jgi:hypothetical protein